jgi:voltage-gated potassium channel
MSPARRATEPNRNPLREKVREIIFEADTPAGKLFDVLLILAIVISVIGALALSVEDLRLRYGAQLWAAEWIFTVLFTIEYGMRLWSAPSARRYALSFYGLVDLLAIVPTYLSVLAPGAEYLIVVRSVRALRVFRVLKMLRYLDAGALIARALKESQRKITIFLLALITVVTIFATVVFIVETPEAGFTSIPMAMYWAIVTMTTVGYGDIIPQTPLGLLLASALMLLGYSIIAVPTGIVTAELTRASLRERPEDLECPACGSRGHDDDAAFCRLCGSALGRRQKKTEQ